MPATAPPFGWGAQWSQSQPVAAGAPWEQLTTNPQAINQLVMPGVFLEIVNLDPTSNQADGSTSVVQIMQAHPIDNTGAYAEFAYLGSSTPYRTQAMHTLIGQHACLHFCAAACAPTTGTRPVVHVTTVRPRLPADLNEPWIVPNQALLALRAALGPKAGAPPPAVGVAGAGMSAGANTAPPPPPASGAPAAASGAAGAVKGEGISAAEKKRRKELNKLLKRAKRGVKGKVQGSLLKKVKRQMTGDGDDSSTSSSSFRDSPPRLDGESRGSRIARLAQEAPGSLLESGLQEVSKYLQARGGVDATQADALAPLMMTYFRSVWQGSNPASEVGQRNNNELEMLAGVIDQLLSGNLAAVGDILMQRFRCVQLASTHGWKVATELELGAGQDGSLVTPELREEALRCYGRHKRIADGIGKAKGGGSS